MNKYISGIIPRKVLVGKWAYLCSYFKNWPLWHWHLLPANRSLAALSILHQSSSKVFLPWSLVLCIQSKVQAWFALYSTFIKTFKFLLLNFIYHSWYFNSPRCCGIKRKFCSETLCQDCFLMKIMAFRFLSFFSLPPFFLPPSILPSFSPSFLSSSLSVFLQWNRCLYFLTRNCFT